MPSCKPHFSIASLIDATNLLIVFHLSKHCFFHLDDLSCTFYDWSIDHLASQRNNAFALFFCNADGFHNFMCIINLCLCWAEYFVDALNVSWRDRSLAGEAQRFRKASICIQTVDIVNIGKWCVVNINTACTSCTNQSGAGIENLVALFGSLAAQVSSEVLTA